MTIIEDELSRTRELRERLAKRLEFLIAMDAPKQVIEYVQNVEMNMTYTEYMKAQRQIQEEFKREKIEYAKNNPLKQSITEEIYARMEKLPYNQIVAQSRLNFDMEIDAITIMGEPHYDYGLYDDILNHAHELYCNKQ
jgi:molybdenum cofactor biosynthesis enzyme MoaA